jgi:hypothetical protein
MMKILELPSKKLPVNPLKAIALPSGDQLGASNAKSAGRVRRKERKRVRRFSPKGSTVSRALK